MHDHLQRVQVLGVQVPQDVAGVVLGREEEQRGVTVVLYIISQLDGFDLPFPLLVCAWLAAAFPVPDGESYVRNRPLVVVVVATRVGAEGEVAGSGSSSRSSLGCEGARGRSVSGRRSSAVDAVAIVHVVVVRRLVHLVRVVVV